MECKPGSIILLSIDNGVDLFFVTETWLSAQGDEAKTVELAPSGFDVKSFPRQSRSRGGGIATVYKYTLGSNITFKTNFDFTHTSFEVVQASITLQHNTHHSSLMLVTSKRSKHLHNLPTSITIGNAQIPFKQSVKNLGFTLDCHITMNAHVSNIARTCYFELRRLAYIRRFLTSTATATLVSAFVLSRIDYCNSLLFGSTLDVTSHLQRIQNYAARVILRLPMSSRITIHLKSLHWLPVKVRTTYKIACLCYHCHSSTAPSYVTDMLHKKPLHTRNTRSSSYTMPLLNRPAHSKATLGDRSFSFASSSVWNSFPNDVKCAPSLSSFKSRLKTYLFRSVYKD